MGGVGMTRIDSSDWREYKPWVLAPIYAALVIVAVVSIFIAVASWGQGVRVETKTVTDKVVPKTLAEWQALGLQSQPVPAESAGGIEGCYAFLVSDRVQVFACP